MPRHLSPCLPYYNYRYLNLLKKKRKVETECEKKFFRAFVKIYKFKLWSVVNSNLERFSFINNSWVAKNIKWLGKRENYLKTRRIQSSKRSACKRNKLGRDWDRNAIKIIKENCAFKRVWSLLYRQTFLVNVRALRDCSCVNYRVERSKNEVKVRGQSWHPLGTFSYIWIF